MKAELLGSSTYKITLDRSETLDMPSDGEPRRMHSFICAMIDRLSREQGITIPDGRLLAEAFLKSDGSCVFFLSSLERGEDRHAKQLFACDLTGVDRLRPLCGALSETGTSCSIYCGSIPDRYRIIFTDPSPNIERICSEFGEYSEITPLFAAQTREYLTEIASGSAAAVIADILCGERD